MFVSRIVSIILRAAQFVTAALVLGLYAYELHLVHREGNRPAGFKIYSLVVSVLSIICSIILLIPFKFSVMWPIDFVLAAMWMAAFGVAEVRLDSYNLLENGWCERAWRDWHGDGWAWDFGYCDRWKAMLAFTFITGFFWFLSFCLSLWAWRQGEKKEEAKEKAARRSSSESDQRQNRRSAA